MRKQQQKRKRSNRQIAYTGDLSIQEAQNLIQHEDEAQEVSTTGSVGAASTASQPSIQASTWCSDCHIIDHKRLQCPNCNRA